ncbi:unnamed protein product [marine sediment metagenome]|uniref:Uncharacterized protein n=1 Tax=marine sediment metagenome TaxID=412755 RepID=X1EC43_9ZZZZ
MSILEKLQNINRRYIYLLAWVFVLFPLLFPLGLPIPIGRESKAWKEYIENIPDDSTIIVTMDYGVSGMPELYPMTVATMHHLWTDTASKNFKIVVIATWNQGPLVFDTLLDQMNPASTYGVVYGEDWIELGWIPGSETGMAALATDMWSQTPRDFLEDRPLSDYPIMENIKTAEDIDLIVSFETGTPGLPEWLRQWNTPYGTPFIVGCIGVSVPGMAPYLASGQLDALMPGLTASGEYEVLIGRPGLAVSGLDAVSMSHLLVVLLVLVGNIAFFASKAKGVN